MFSFLKRRIKKLLFISDANSTNFKLVDVGGTPEAKDVSVTYQVCGKMTAATAEPSKLVDDLLILKGFTKEDSDVIHGLALREKESAQYKITRVLFDETDASLCICDVKNNFEFRQKVLEVIKDDKLMRSLPEGSIPMILALAASQLKRFYQERPVSGHQNNSLPMRIVR